MAMAAFCGCSDSNASSVFGCRKNYNGQPEQLLAKKQKKRSKTLLKKSQT